jgi:hypothetical protein
VNGYEQITIWLDILARNTYPEVANLLYYSTVELTPEEIVEKALDHYPIITPPPLSS